MRAGPASSLAGAPCLLTASVRAPDSAAPATGSSTGRANVDVPALTQMIDPQLGPRLCSPTSVTMVISHFGGDADLLEVAHAAYHPAHDLYGVWPAALYAASRHGLLGYLLRFPDWATARWLLEHLVAIVASIRYGRDLLPGAAAWRPGWACSAPPPPRRGRPEDEGTPGRGARFRGGLGAGQRPGRTRALTGPEGLPARVVPPGLAGRFRCRLRPLPRRRRWLTRTRCAVIFRPVGRLGA